MSDAAQSWREWLADPDRTGTSSPEVINRAVTSATGEQPAMVERLLHGEINEVYDVTTAGGVRVVVRIGHRSPSLFPAERWAITSAAANGALVPDVLLVDEDSDNGDPLAICVERHAGGQPLQQLAIDAGTAEPFADIVRAAGQNLALVHQVKTEGFGWPLDEQGRGPDKGWDQFLAMPAREPEWYEPGAVEAGYPAERFQRVLGVLEAHASIYADAPKLVHADFGAKHVLADEDGLRGLIDFETCRGGDPVYDIAAWDIYFHNTLRTEWLLDGYREVGSLGSDFDTRLALGLMVLAVRLLGHSVGGYKGFVPLAVKTLDREVTKFV